MTSNKSSKTTSIGIRIPNDLLADIDRYGTAHALNRSQALISLARAGFAAQEGEVRPASADQLAAVSAKLDAAIAQQQAMGAILLTLKGHASEHDASRGLPNGNDNKKKKGRKKGKKHAK